jgi:hypothetical protein
LRRKCRHHRLHLRHSASYRDSYASSAAKPLDLGLLTVLFGEGSRCIGETGPVALPAASLPAAFEANSLQGAGGGSAEGESSYPGLYGATPSGPVGRGTAAAAAVGAAIPWSTSVWCRGESVSETG